ncbi:MAG: hypothetical protein KatS3mg108_2430 [Isosphaeraceae bacterium]|nr:MAG: hypothetical protein KatS3mg108_2430 [Isosphaeraceae bacterium]
MRPTELSKTACRPNRWPHMPGRPNGPQRLEAKACEPTLPTRQAGSARPDSSPAGKGRTGLLPPVIRHVREIGSHRPRFFWLCRGRSHRRPSSPARTVFIGDERHHITTRPWVNTLPRENSDAAVPHDFGGGVFLGEAIATDQTRRSISSESVPILDALLGPAERTAAGRRRWPVATAALSTDGSASGTDSRSAAYGERDTWGRPRGSGWGAGSANHFGKHFPKATKSRSGPASRILRRSKAQTTFRSFLRNPIQVSESAVTCTSGWPTWPS